MSGKTRTEKIRRLRANPDCLFIGNEESKTFHAKNCWMIEGINNKDLVGITSNPIPGSYRPCPICNPKPVPVKQTQEERRNTPLKSKADLMKEAMFDIANRRKLYIEFKGSFVYVTTIAGEWYFDYNARPITLHHKNENPRRNERGKILSHYHVQRLTFETPLLALAYIANHERAAENRLFEVKKPAEDVEYLKKRYTEWTLEEDETLEEFYPKEGLKVARRINRSVKACQHRAQKLGLRVIKQKEMPA